MYNIYGANKKGAQYEFRLYAPQATQVYLVLNGQQLKMTKEGTNFALLADAKHLDTYYYLIDGQKKFDPFAKYITDGYESRVYESSYVLKHKPLITPIDDDSKVLELYLPFINGDDYKEKAEHIIDKVKDGQYTHVLLLPLQHHWYIGSMGYHTQGFFAPTHFYGTPDALKEMIDRLHEEGISIILDFAWWETTQSPGIDDLYNFAGNVYLNEEYNEEFGGHYFDFKNEYVINFMKASFNYWLNVYNVDYLKLDGINEFIYTRPEHKLLQDKIDKINVLTEGIEDRLILEFISDENPKEVGFNVEKHDGIFLSYVLQSLYRQWEDDLVFKQQRVHDTIEQKLFNDGQLTGANHNLFLKGVSYNEPLPEVMSFQNLFEIAKLFVKEVDEAQIKELSFILKLIYATKRPVVEFGHLDIVNEELALDYKSYRQVIDTIYNTPEIVAEENGYTIKYSTKDVYFDFINKEVSFVEKQI